ncbi:hypothetical protein [Psychroserpens mesophilus]|uniref:hypothetical protein n=1 Tax=Psychroserpens mesophilus TaxID=325473 RepID=UPI003D660397
MDKNPSKYFDKILTFLSSDYNRTFTINEVVNHIYKKEIKNNSKISSGLDGLIADSPYKSNIINAIMFLNSEGLVAYDKSEETVFINTKGFVKNKTEGFVSEIRNKKANLWLQRLAWLVAILTFIFFVFSKIPKEWVEKIF